MTHPAIIQEMRRLVTDQEDLDAIAEKIRTTPSLERNFNIFMEDFNEKQSRDRNAQFLEMWCNGSLKKCIAARVEPIVVEITKHLPEDSTPFRRAMEVSRQEALSSHSVASLDRLTRWLQMNEERESAFGEEDGDF
jgi:hypothetical protein